MVRSVLGRQQEWLWEIILGAKRPESFFNNPRKSRVSVWDHEWRGENFRHTSRLQLVIGDRLDMRAEGQAVNVDFKVSGGKMREPR